MISAIEAFVRQRRPQPQRRRLAEQATRHQPRGVLGGPGAGALEAMETGDYPHVAALDMDAFEMAGEEFIEFGLTAAARRDRASWSRDAAASRLTRPPMTCRGIRPRPARSPVAIRPIRLFGDPVLRQPGDRGRRLRQGAAHAGPDLTDTMLDAPGRGPGRTADRGRAARLHLERRGRGRPPGQPVARALRGDPGRPRGLPVAARAHLRLQARAVGRRHRLRHVRRAGDRSRAASCWPGRSSTRPTTSTGSSSSTSSTPTPARPR